MSKRVYISEKQISIIWDCICSMENHIYCLYPNEEERNGMTADELEAQDELISRTEEQRDELMKIFKSYARNKS